jgi:hypothetical protein
MLELAKELFWGVERHTELKSDNPRSWVLNERSIPFPSETIHHQVGSEGRKKGCVSEGAAPRTQRRRGAGPAKLLHTRVTAFSDTTLNRIHADLTGAGTAPEFPPTNSPLRSEKRQPEPTHTNASR